MLINDDVSSTYKLPGSYETMDEIIITETRVTKLLQKPKPYKALGQDNFRPRIRKELALNIAPVLTIIFKRSLDTGVVPQNWRQANMTPIYKKGEKYKAENYQPVTLTSAAK